MIQPVNALTPKVFFKGRKNELDNPVNRKLEKRLAILNAGGISAVAGALTTAIARSYTASWKNAGMFGIGAGFVTMMFICPRFMYKSGINSYKKEKEVQKKLLTDVNEAIDHGDSELNVKLENYSKAKKD